MAKGSSTLLRFLKLLLQISKKSSQALSASAVWLLQLPFANEVAFGFGRGLVLEQRVCAVRTDHSQQADARDVSAVTHQASWHRWALLI